MTLWGNIEPKASRLIRDLDADELHDRLDQMREQIKTLSHAFSRTAGQQLGRARHAAVDAAEDVEGVMKDHLAASMLLALGLGVVVGYFLRRG